jgi:hypothetical protein
MMRIDLNGKRVELFGATNPITEALTAALADNGATVGAAEAPDILVVSLPLLPEPGVDIDVAMSRADRAAEAMAAGAGGRVVFLVSSIAGLPARRHADYSLRMATVLAAMRGIAMRHGPNVMANAVGVGAVGEPLVAGDAAFVGHTGLQRTGTVEEVVATALFFCDPLNSYTTGQLLNVDGGWAAGYGRSF